MSPLQQIRALATRGIVGLYWHHDDTDDRREFLLALVDELIEAGAKPTGAGLGELEVFRDFGGLRVGALYPWCEAYRHHERMKADRAYFEAHTTGHYDWPGSDLRGGTCRRCLSDVSFRIREAA